MSRIFGVFIGINEYQDPNITALQCCSNDAQDLAELFAGIDAKVNLLLDSQATNTAIRTALWELTEVVNPEDTAIVFFAGHGSRISIPRRDKDPETIPCLLPHDAYRESLMATGIPMEDIGRIFECIPCKRVVFFFDSCYSGSMANCRSYRIPNERVELPEQKILPKIAGEGTIIFAASSEYQPAFEDEQTGHGVFTECLVEVLSGQVMGEFSEQISLDKIQQYLQEQVPNRTRKRFNKNQTPIQHGTITERITFPVMKTRNNHTLVSFPYQFLPLTIVVGDRRETTPKTSGDVFALSASPAELRWLLALGLPRGTEIISDKVFRQADLTYLKENYGKTNLLVIGSPAANLFTRLVNETALFPFSISQAAKSQYKKMSYEIDEIGNRRGELVNFATDARNRDSLGFYMNEYRKGGFLDPTYDFFRRGERIPHDKDYGTVTVARNPYASSENGRFISILVAGVCLPGTMHGLRLLGNARKSFTERPFGGIFSVELSESDWTKRMTHAGIEWSTDPYDIATLRRGLQELKNKEDELEIKGEIDEKLKLLDQVVNIKQ